MAAPAPSPVSLDSLLAPTAVTVVGASARNHAARGLLENLLDPVRGFRGAVNLVSRTQPSLFGRSCVGSLTEVEGDVGIVYLLVGDAPAREVLTELAGLGRRPAAVVIYAEDRSLPALVPRGVPVLGPGSVGLLSLPSRLLGITGPQPEFLSDGPVALVMQSGGLMGATIRALTRRSLTPRYAVHLGRAGTAAYAEMLTALLVRDDVAAVGSYVEVVDDLHALLEVGRLARSLGKPMVLAVSGTTEIGARAVASHIGATATPRALVAGVCAQAGVPLVASCDELVWSLDGLAEAGFRRPTSPTVGILASSGGAAVHVTDRLQRAGIETTDPFDVGAASHEDDDAYGRLVEQFAADPAIGMVVRVAGVGLPSSAPPMHRTQADAFRTAVQRAGKLPVLAAVVAEPVPDDRSADGTIVAASLDELAAKLSALADWCGRHAPHAELAGDAATAPGERRMASGRAARTLLHALDARWPATVTVGPGEPVPEPLRFALPAMVKAEAGLAHRRNSGGVLGPFTTTEQVALAVRLLHSQFAAAVEVIEYVEHDIEYYAGVQRLGSRSMVLAFGRTRRGDAQDASIVLCPASEDELQRLVARYVAIGGDRDALVGLLAQLQHLASAEGIESVDLNPVVVVRTGAENQPAAVVLDAKVLIDESRDSDS